MTYFFVGIKGTGMSALAQILKELGYEVVGSDKPDHFFTEQALLEKGIKIYDPWIEEKKYEAQYTDFESFINDVELVVVMVGHNHIRENMECLEGKLVVY